VVAEKPLQIAEQSVGPNQPSVGERRKGGDKMENVTSSPAFWTIVIIMSPIILAGFFLIYKNSRKK
jgi:hypothetical protein